MLFIFVLLFVRISIPVSPIWVDEYLHFSLSVAPQWKDALRSIHETTGTVKLNHGQTGFYMFLNYLFLTFFGASYWALRIPSYLSYVASSVAGFYFLRQMNVSFFLRIVFVMALSFSSLSSTHGAEARPYMPLQATVLGFLWAWHNYLEAEGRLISLVGISLLGVLFHPFFVLYAGLILVLSILFLPEIRSNVIAKIKSKKEITILLPSAFLLIVVFVALGHFTWFSSMGQLRGRDPYEWIKSDKPLYLYNLAVVFHPLGKFWVPIGSLISLFLVWKRREGEYIDLFHRYLYLALLFTISQFILCYITIKSEYWVLPRQWVAGQAISFLVSAILLEVLVRKISWISKAPTRNFLNVAAVIMVLFFLIFSIDFRWKNRLAPKFDREKISQLLTEYKSKGEVSMENQVIMANENLLYGGPVWNLFGRVYGYTAK